MGNGAFLEMLNEDAHFGMIAETSILLVEAKMSWMEVDNQRWSTAFVLAQDMGLLGYYGSEAVSHEHEIAGARWDKP